MGTFTSLPLPANHRPGQVVGEAPGWRLRGTPLLRDQGLENSTMSSPVPLVGIPAHRRWPQQPGPSEVCFSGSSSKASEPPLPVAFGSF